MKIKTYEIEDPISSHSKRAIEVSIVTEQGDRRWCFFFTPQGVAACGDYIHGTKVRFHYGASHMIVVSEISQEIIESALKDIEKRGELESCTLLVSD